MKKRKPSLFEVESSGVQLKGWKGDGSDQSWQTALGPAADQAIQHYELNTPKPSKLFIVAALLILVVFAGLGWQLFQLQVVQAARFQELANGNRIREQITYAPRGRILDRNGRVLADNTATFQVTVTPYLLSSVEIERERSIQLMAEIIGQSAAEMSQLIDEKGLDYPLPILIDEAVDHKVALKIEQRLPEASGFSLDSIPARAYDATAGLAHILGYTGRVSEAELTERQDELLPVDFVGKAGIEKSYDAQLRGVNGQERVEIDALGKPVRLLAQNQPARGNDIRLTIDYDLQVRLEQAMRAQMQKSQTDKGAGVVVHPKTGEILAMVSIPYYDNNIFADGGVTEAEFARLENDPGKPLINRVIQAGYSSGSTIKPVVAAGALESGVVTPDTIIVDSGAITAPTEGGGQPFIFRGWRPEGLGPMNVRSAIAMSSNIYFYTVGGGHNGIQGLGEDRLTALYRDFGLGEVSGLDVPIEYPGRVPSEEWKRELTGEGWYVGDSYNISIGQGDLLLTPLQLSLADMAIANGGDLLKPRLVAQIGEQVIDGANVRRRVGISDANLQIVREGMRQVLTAGTTSESTFRATPVQVAGKSGTAQTTSDDSRRPHAWFTAFAPWQDPEIYATVIIEEGSGGSLYSAPAIAEVFDQYFNR